MLDRIHALFISCISWIMITLSLQTHAADFHSPRTDGLGGAGHASPLLTDAIYLNPSFTSFMFTHALSTHYLSYCCGTQQTPQGPTDFHGHNLNISVLDGTTEAIFQAGVGYTRREDAALLHIGASKSIARRLGIGTGVKVIFPNEKFASRITDATFSASGLISSWFQSALIIDNLFESAQDRSFYRDFILGTKFNITKIILLYLDPHWMPSLPQDKARWGYQTGLEFPFFSELFLRMGIFKNSMIPYQAQLGDGYGFGLGWLAPRLSVDYAFSRVTQPLSSLAHNFGFSIYF